jgi:ABC-2 type transport system ATP-binding protein
MSEGQSPAAISIEGVTKVFAPAPGWLRLLVRSPITEEIHALDDVTFRVEPGEVCALVGPNGAGKTTLFRILVGLTTPSSGRALVLGHDVVSESLQIRRRVGWMPTSDQTLFQRHTCAENLRFHGRLHGLSGVDLEKAVDEALDLVDLMHAKNNAVLALSAGMKARLQLARALLHKPSLLILDEPTASVDPVASLAIINLIMSVVRERNLAAIVSSHRLDEIEALHSHVLLLHRGEVLFDGDLDDLRAKVDRTVWEMVFTSPEAASQISSTISSAKSVEAIEVDGASIQVTLNHGASVGPVLASLSSHLNELVTTREVHQPLRDVLANVYGVADDGRGS